jgi:K+-transporting ATPase A subunit
MELFSSLSTCFGNGDKPDPLKGGCGWKELGPIVNELLSNMVLLGFFIAVLMIFYAGYILVTKQGSADARTQVKKIFMGVVIGMILLVGAYYIVEFVLDTLGVGQEFRKDTII